MRDKIKARLKDKFPGVNLSNDRLDAIADKLTSKITEETQIDAELDFLNELQPFKEIAAYDDWQRTKKTKQQQQAGQGQQQQSSQQQQTDDPNAAILQQLQALNEKVSAFEKKEQQQKLSDTLAKRLQEKKIPTAFLKGRTVESEDQLDAVLSEVEADFTAVKQELVNQGFSQTSTPVGGSTTLKTDNVEADILAHFGKDKK